MFFLFSFFFIYIYIWRDKYLPRIFSGDISAFVTLCQFSTCNFSFFSKFHVSKCTIRFQDYLLNKLQVDVKSNVNCKLKNYKLHIDNYT